ncbi:hypothetical protein TNIN_189771 [Trichonephila inaurata madagascariensis]|uniref:Uncharacterized protein n=1 Tax=Trichonephila inaurata madagascariensis TaxID=2747483 RepID=A0A8X6JKA9_9ARAC|nr:hypothetical protein TNIN_189771 [Trichonephila inaurata madagascariensis]
MIACNARGSIERTIFLAKGHNDMLAAFLKARIFQLGDMGKLKKETKNDHLPEKHPIHALLCFQQLQLRADLQMA